MKMSCSAKWFTTLIKALRFSKSPWLAPFCVKVFTDNFFSSQLHSLYALRKEMSSRIFASSAPDFVRVNWRIFFVH